MRKPESKHILLAGAAILAMSGGLVVSGSVFGPTPVAYADEHGGKGGMGGKGQGGAGEESQGHYGKSGTSGGSSVEGDVFHGGGKDSAGGHSDDEHGEDTGEEEDSDRPEWAGTPGKEGKPGRGNAEPGVAKGDLFGDLYVLLRDEDGVPILNDKGFVQPVDAEGNPIPLDEEGHPLDESLTQEVEIGRLNVGRAPTQVLDARMKEVVSLFDQATAISTDPAGRLVLTIDGEEKTIDSPLENLAMYLALVSTGTLGINTSNEILGDYAFLNDGTLTAEDLSAAASLLAAATDKAAPMSIDQVVYVNSFIGIDGPITQNNIDYLDFSTFSYDRSDTFGDATATVLVKEGDVWVEKTVDLYDVVFNSQDFTSESGIDGFVQAADDARAIINYIHEYATPETAE